MGAKTNYFRLGLFVVAAIAAAVASIVILLGPSLGKPYAEMETYFQFSISGLEVGAPVKFRGIQVGQVQEILLSTEAYPSSSQEILSETKAVAVVRMRMELAGKEVESHLQDYINHGLRVQTQLAGITGSLYLSLDFLDPKKYPADRVPFDWKPKYLFIPSAPSLSNEIVENVKGFLASLDSLNINKDLQETVPVIQSLIANLERIANGIDPSSFSKLGSSLSSLLNQADNKINQFDINQLNTLIAQLDKSAEQIGNLSQKAETKQLVTNLTNLSRNLNQMVSNNGYDVSVTLMNLSKIAQNLKNLTNNISGSASEFLAPAPKTLEPFQVNK